VVGLLFGGLLVGGCSGPREAPGGAADPVGTDEPLRTRAEVSGYEETSTYDDVVRFLAALDAASAGLHVTTFGESVEGRALPLAVWGAPDATAEAARATGKTRVLVFANIHAGEVDGKEAVLALLRGLARGAHAAWADSLVVLAVPLYNADGNERVAYENRPLQLGPVGGMGQRPNAQGLDLNRDFVKLAAPESRALVGVMRDYDPHVVVDLHTTDGTLMAYHLTYAPPLHPNTDDGLVAELWDRWLPAVTEAVAREDGWAFFHYGNVPGAFGEPVTVPRGWYTFDWRPRFSTNYAGLRSRFGILSESYSYAPFEERVAASRRLVEEVLAYVWAHASRLRALVAQADAGSVVGDPLALSATWAALPEPVEVLLGEADTVYHPVTNAPMLRMRRDVRIPETMPAYVRFEPAETERAPEAYLVPTELTELVDLLDRHGIEHAPGPPSRAVRALEAFAIDSLRVAERAFQGRRAVTLFGRWRPRAEALPDQAGYRYVPVAQPLGRLLFALLEPRSDDGVVAWAVPGIVEALQTGGDYPILRLPARD
jgi:hypothetical protein